MDLHMEKEIMKIIKNHILVNGEMILDMELVKKNLKIKKENMLEALLMISIKEKESYLIKNLFIKVNSKQEYFMDQDLSNIKMDRFSKDHFKII
jgi:hypothetical protein